MSKGAILDEAMVHAIGLAEQLLTLKGPIENRHHPVLQEPLFVFNTDEIPEPVYLERKYVFDNQVSIKGSYSQGDKVLVWLAHSLKPNPHDPKAPPVVVLLARDLFLLGDWREFQRFKQFIKSCRILDAQARQWLSDHHGDLEQLSAIADGLSKVIAILGRISEWPELEGGQTTRSGSLEGVAKTFSKDLIHVRDAPLFPTLLLRREPAVRFSVFRLMSFVEDPARGAAGLVAFITALGKATRDPEVIQSIESLKTSRDLARAFAALRKFLLSSTMPGVDSTAPHASP